MAKIKATEYHDAPPSIRTSYKSDAALLDEYVSAYKNEKFFGPNSPYGTLQEDIERELGKARCLRYLTQRIMDDMEIQREEDKKENFYNSLYCSVGTLIVGSIVFTVIQIALKHLL